jgi:hypothetical protein
MIQLYPRDAEIVADVLGRLADLYGAGSTGEAEYQHVWDWSPPEGAHGKVGDREYREDQADRLKLIIAAIQQQLE